MNAHSSSDSEDDETDSASVADSAASVTDSEASIAEMYSDLADEITSRFDLATADGNFPITAFFPVLRPHRLERTRDVRTTNYFPRLPRSSSRSLFDLPPELRVQIYEYCLPQISPDWDFVTAIEDSQIMCDRCVDELCRLEEQRSHSLAEPSRGYTALLLTCKAIYKEAVDVLYSPTRSHVPPNFGRVALNISTRIIRLHDYNMFCAKHLAYRKGTDSTFSRMRYVELNITVDGLSFYDLDRSASPTTLCGWAYVLENVQWVVHQLRQAGNLKKLILSVNWIEKLASMGGIRTLLGPFSVLRNISHVELHNFNTSGWMVNPSEFDVCKYEWQALLAGNGLVHEPPVPLHFWNLLKRLLLQFPVEYRDDALEDGYFFYDNQDSNAIQRLMVDMYSTCLEDGKMWAKFGERFTTLAYAGLLFQEDRSSLMG